MGGGGRVRPGSGGGNVSIIERAGAQTPQARTLASTYTFNGPGRRESGVSRLFVSVALDCCCVCVFSPWRRGLPTVCFHEYHHELRALSQVDFFSACLLFVLDVRSLLDGVALVLVSDALFARTSCLHDDATCEGVTYRAVEVKYRSIKQPRVILATVM